MNPELTCTRRRRGHPGFACVAAAAAILLAPPAWAQQASRRATNGLRAEPAVPLAVAVRAEQESPRLDGQLDEAVWQAAPVISDFVQKDPNEGEPSAERTEVRVLFTDDAVYVGIRAWDSQPDAISAVLTRRDEMSPSDWLIVAFDSYYDRRTGFAFFVNPAGVKRDEYLFDDCNGDDSWDAVWDVATSTDPEGWTAEFRIPFSQLRFSEADQQMWGFNVARIISRLNEESHWQLMPKGECSIVSRFGDLAGIEGIEPPRRVEVLPYVAAVGGLAARQDGNPFQTGRDGSLRGGADVNVGVTSNLTLSATINPDFGQVEADPAVVNLSAFETFYPEKRPFFNEGLDIFRFPILLGDGNNANEQLFYTRRVGRAPQGSADPRGGFAESVRQTTILGAGKLSGKTPSGWTIGLLGALTAEEDADVLGGDGLEYSDVVEPRSTYFVGRLAKDFRDGASQVGFFGTAMNRQLPDELTWMRSDAFAGGFDWSHRFGTDDTYHVDGWIVGSHVRGSAEAIANTQLSSARYYQRPDADHVQYDPTRTSLTGFAGQLVLGKRRGDKWVWAGGFDTRTPGFEVNDAGFQREADRTVQFLWAQRRWLQPGKVFRRFSVNVNQYTVWSWGWERMGTGGNVNANWQFLNYWGGNIGWEHSAPVLSPGALRGGPAFLRPYTTSMWGGFYTDDRKELRGGLHGSAFLQPASATWGYNVSPSVAWRPAANMNFTFAPGLFHQFDSWQYLSTEEALGESQYLFGELRQTVASMTFRGDVTFTPDLTLQLYAEPFVASGTYEGFRRVADPRGATFDDRFDDFGPDRLTEVLDPTSGAVESYAIDLNADQITDITIGNPDFTYMSFRSNVVLRWEYLPGSTLFLVWQHGRSDYDSDGRFRLGDSLSRLWDLQSENTFVVKFNYWLSL